MELYDGALLCGGALRWSSMMELCSAVELSDRALLCGGALRWALSDRDKEKKPYYVDKCWVEISEVIIVFGYY